MQLTALALYSMLRKHLWYTECKEITYHGKLAVETAVVGRTHENRTKLLILRKHRTNSLT